jgi:hypothetical protein
LGEGLKLFTVKNSILLRSVTQAQNQVEEDEMGRACSTHGRDEKYEILVGISKGKRLRVRYRHRWEGNITVDLEVIG